MFVSTGKWAEITVFFSWFFLHSKKQYTDLFALAAEDDTSGVGRRGTSGRGRKPPLAKKETNSTNSNKKNSEPVYNSSDESSEVWSSYNKQKIPFSLYLNEMNDTILKNTLSFLLLQEDFKPRSGKRRKKALSDSDWQTNLSIEYAYYLIEN